jgi:growth factor-regulated tyrosine kinase substrate
MKLEGYQYPVLKEAEAMFDVEEAPAWKDDTDCSNCFRCRAEFTTLRRRHHCRACGQIFCHTCSSKVATIPKYGIEKEVRVCDVCYDKIKVNQVNNQSSSSNSPNDELPTEYINSQLFKEAKVEATKPKAAEKTKEEFEEELQLALALSQSEAEASEKSKKKKNYSSSSSSSSKSSTKQQKSLSSSSNNNPFPQLSNASAPSYEEELSKPKSSIQENDDSNVSSSSAHSEQEALINKEIDDFVEEVKRILELYINRMKSDSIRGRSITNDTAVQSLFLQLQHLHPKLLSYIKYQEDARAYYENLQDKLTQLKDAREALNALRHENFEKKKRDLEEQERIRQIQISQKLQFMRQQKQNYYLYQNQLNLQRLQEHEQELQLRLSQQRELVLQRDQQFSLPTTNNTINPALTNFRQNELISNNYNNYNQSMLPPQHHQQQQQQQPSNFIPNPNYQNGAPNMNIGGLQSNQGTYNVPNLEKSNINTLENQFQSLQMQQQPQQHQLAPMPQAQSIPSLAPHMPQATQQNQYQFQQQQHPPQQQHFQNPNAQYQQYQQNSQVPQQQQLYQQNGYADPSQYQMPPQATNEHIQTDNNNAPKEAQLISFD